MQADFIVFGAAESELYGVEIFIVCGKVLMMLAIL